MPIRLLVVDDSAFMRKIIGDLVKDINNIEVIGIARNGLDALEVIPKLNPDVITLDIEMPKLNGIDTLKEIKKKSKIPVIMLSSHTGTDITMEALQMGAEDFIEKPTDLNANLKELKNELEQKIKSVVSKVIKPKPFKPASIEPRKTGGIGNSVEAVVIGASTGGPKALFYLISKIPKYIKVPIFIVQHMPKGFTTSFAARLDNECNIPVVEARNNMPIQRGTIYVAPGDFHMTIDGHRITLDSGNKIHGVRPAVDYLFDSAAKVYKKKLLGIILTGMGKDGAQGMVSIKENGGYNLAQNEESCVVYGMPGSAVSKGAVHEVLNLDEISSYLNKSIRVTT